jgi:isochorismate hydrolase
MSKFGDRPNTALLVVDVQNGVVKQAHKREAVLANIARLVENARREQAPVVWIQHHDEQLVQGSEDWRIVGELNPAAGEPLIEKNYGDSFENTTLENVLSRLGAGELVVVGAQTDACIRSTLHGAFVRGYDVTLVTDAHTTEIKLRGVRHRRNKSSRIPICIGNTRRRRGGRQERCRRARSRSAGHCKSTVFHQPSAAGMVG